MHPRGRCEAWGSLSLPSSPGQQCGRGPAHQERARRSLPRSGPAGHTQHGLCGGPGCREPEPRGCLDGCRPADQASCPGAAVGIRPGGWRGSAWTADAIELPGSRSLCGASLSRGVSVPPQQHPGSPLSTVCFSVVTCAVCAPGHGAPRGSLPVSSGSRASAVTQPRCCFVGLLVPVEGEHPPLLILGVLLALRYLVPLLQPQVKDTSLKGSFGVTRKEMEVSPSTEQLVQVGAPELHSGACADGSSVRKRSCRTESRGLRVCTLEWTCWLSPEVVAPGP